MKHITNILAEMLQNEHPEIEVKALNTGAKLIKSSAQAKYDDLRATEKNYTHGVHNSLMEDKK
jgi:hypothetical protein